MSEASPHIARQLPRPTFCIRFVRLTRSGACGPSGARPSKTRPGSPYFLQPRYQATNVLWTPTNTGANDAYDLLTLTNLNWTNWTLLMRGTNGQTRFSVTNPPPSESYYRAASTNR